MKQDCARPGGAPGEARVTHMPIARSRHGGESGQEWDPMEPLSMGGNGNAHGAPSYAQEAGRRPERTGTLFRFVNYLHRMGVLKDSDTLDSLEVQQALQKYAYIAKRVGMNLDYTFKFLDVGAFSVDIGMDIYRRCCAKGGTEPFEGDPGASRAFLEIVRGRDIEWLEAATLAMDGRHGGETRDEFAERAKRENLSCGRDTAVDAFDHVMSCVGRLESWR
ncbi:MAG: hypothetical protein OXU86_05575 [Thaumarchaeota archaeon]|nr:hypothetical protein [Nitrososphaerota archaeon]